MEDFTRNINLRALSVSDFVKVKEIQYDDSFVDITYKLSDQFELNGSFEIFHHTNNKSINGFWLEYRIDEEDMFNCEADTFEEVLEAFNDWRMKIYSDLLFLPDNKTITIKMTGYANNF